MVMCCWVQGSGVEAGLCTICAQQQSLVAAGSNVYQPQVLHLYMLLLITWVAGDSGEVAEQIPLQLIQPVLVSCVTSRLENAGNSL